MSSYLLLRNLSMSHVYAGEAAILTTAESKTTASFVLGAAQVEVAGVDYLAFDAEYTGRDKLTGIARQSSAFALFQCDDDLLWSVVLPRADVPDDDLTIIPKYQGKINEQFTQLLLSVTVVVARHSASHRVLGLTARRSTTILTTFITGCDAFGVETDDKTFDTMAVFYKA